MVQPGSIIFVSLARQFGSSSVFRLVAGLEALGVKPLVFGGAIKGRVGQTSNSALHEAEQAARSSSRLISILPLTPDGQTVDNWIVELLDTDHTLRARAHLIFVKVTALEDLPFPADVAASLFAKVVTIDGSGQAADVLVAITEHCLDLPCSH